MRITTIIVLLLSVEVTTSFVANLSPSCFRSSDVGKLHVADEYAILEKIKQIIKSEEDQYYDPNLDMMVKSSFPYALTNGEIEESVVNVLSEKGFTATNTLLATSFCCDEVCRQLEEDFSSVYGKNFFLGGLSGFPFGGQTGFGAMSGHIPDNGFCFIVYGTHVGITRDGVVGKVERVGKNQADDCCGSLTAASNYLLGIMDGEAKASIGVRSFTDFQQSAIQELILPYATRLAQADNRALELPYAMYESVDLMMRTIIQQGASGLKTGTAVLGGVMVNTGPGSQDYFHPLRFDYLDTDGSYVEDLLPLISTTPGRPGF